MAQSPAARNVQPNVVQLSPTVLIGPNKLLAADEKTAKHRKQSPNGESYKKGFMYHAKYYRKAEEQRLSQRSKLHEQDSSLHFAKLGTKVCAAQKLREPKQLPLLAQKIHKECNEAESITKLVDRDDSRMHGDDLLQVGDRVEVRDRDMEEWRSGVVTDMIPLKVMLNKWDQAFQWDFVRKQKLVAPKLTPENCATKTDSTSLKAPSRQSAAAFGRSGSSCQVARPELLCTCGHRFQADAIFCCRCGRQRACEVFSRVPKPCTKQPQPEPWNRTCSPNTFVAHAPTIMQRSASDFSIWMRSQRERSNEFRDRGKQLRDRENTSEVSPQLVAWTGVNCFRHENSQISTCAERMPEYFPEVADKVNQSCLQWQQLTVPILADDGGVIELRPALADADGAWKHSTVPIRGENGETIALRPPFNCGPTWEWRPDTLPIFNEEGSIVALPSGGRCEWQQNTVPILSENGEVFALRPASKKAWKQKVLPVFGGKGEVLAICSGSIHPRHWEQMTVTLAGQDGEMTAIRPSCGVYQMPQWNTSGCRFLGSQLPQGALSTIGSDRTNVAATQLLKIRRKRSDASSEEVSDSSSPQSRESPKFLDAPPVCSGKDADCSSHLLRRSGDNGQQPDATRSKGKTPFLTEPVFGHSLEVESIVSSSPFASSIPANDFGNEPKPPSADLKDESPDDTRDAQSLCTSSLVQAGSSAHITPLSIPAVSVPPASPSRESGTHRTDASTDSLASIRELIRIANDARQATPDGHMIHVLQEALVQSPPSGAGSLISSLLRKSDLQAQPEVEELAVRLRQLPELWRSAILKMLEEAEAVQVPPDAPDS